MRERSVAVDLAGVFHECATYGLVLDIEIDGAQIPTPVIPRFPKVASNGVRTLAIFKSGSTPNPGATWVVNNLGQAKELGVNHGVTSVWLRDLPDGTFKAYWIRDLQHYEWAVLDSNLHLRSTGSGINPNGYSDWLFFKGDDPMWTPENSPREVEGVLLHLPVDEGPWTVGQSNIAPPGLLAVNRETHTVYRIFTGDVQLPPHVAIHGPELRVSASSPTATRILTQDDLTLQEIPPVTVTPYERAIVHWAYYTFDAGRGYGNHPDQVLHAAWCETQADVLEANKTGKPVITRRELIGLATKKAFIMVANDAPGQDPLEEQIAASIPLCVALDCGLLIYDEANESPNNAPDWAVWACRLFREPTESLAQYIDRALVTINGTEGERVCAIFGIDDRAGKLTEAQVNETATAIPDIIREAERVSIAAFFSYARAKMVNGTHQKPGGGILYPKAWAYAPASAEASDEIDWSVYHAPETEPEPEESDMPYVVLTEQKPNEPLLKLTKVTEVQHNGKLFLDKANATVCVTPDGKVEDRPLGTRGAWEEMLKSSKGYVADRGEKSFGIVAV